MKTFCLLFMLMSAFLSAQTDGLYPIIENGLWGYINIKGELIIAPKFHSAGEFSEGLAPVRSNGTFGYINVKGNFVIPERYDIAYKFINGYAKVFIDEKPYIINKNGKIIFEHDFEEIQGFGHSNFSVVKLQDDKFSIVDINGKPIVDNAFKTIDFSSKKGIYIVKRYNNITSKKNNSPSMSQTGVIDSTGRMIVEYGKYSHIGSYINGYAQVDTEKQDEEGLRLKRFIDTKGTLFEIKLKNRWRMDYDQVYFSEGLMPISIYTVDPDTITVWSSQNRYDYKGVINLSGDLVFENKNWDKITPFINQRAFVQDFDNKWYLINNRGELLHDEPFDNVINNRLEPRYHSHAFIDEVVFVIRDGRIFGIDTNGKIVLTLGELTFDFEDVYRHDDYLIFETYNSESNINPYLYGFWNFKKDNLVAPQYSYLSFDYLNYGLTFVQNNNLYGYIDANNRYVWQSEFKEFSKNEVNIEYMKRGYYYASSPQHKDDLGGFGGSSNSFKPIKNEFSTIENTLNVLVKSNTEHDPTLYVLNKSSDSIYFSAQDSRLYMVIQAKNKFGEWKDIEYLPSSWCGNSYHKLSLPSYYYWEFKIPNYVGAFETVLRAKLDYLLNDKTVELYSNEFKASINPGQFWNELPYSPRGLMDPYND